MFCIKLHYGFVVNLILICILTISEGSGVHEVPEAAENVDDSAASSSSAFASRMLDLKFAPDPPRTVGLLYPFESESREVRSLDGVWRFLKSNASDPMQGVREKWFENDLDDVSPTVPMPVPSSYNDITTLAELRDHIGTVWYERKFYAPQGWSMGQRVWLRFGSVHYAAIVWLNGIEVARHSIGHLPFEAEVTEHVKYGQENRVTVICDNTLTNVTIPQGKLQQQKSDAGNITLQTYTFDFFNYAGIHRSVHLHTRPMVYVESIHIQTDIDSNNTGYVDYKIKARGSSQENSLMLHLQLRDKTGYVVSHDSCRGILGGRIEVDNVQAWWPYLMHPDPGYMYTLELYLHDANFALLDVYRMPVGIRKLAWDASGLSINGKPVYLHGFGKHEDADIRGKGLDLATLTRDFNLLKWIGGNAYRTSHYPYSEESMQFADEHGIMVIDECPSVNTDIFEPELLVNHKSALEQLINRDRNHPSVIMWSIANEPRSGQKEAETYFGLLVNYTKKLDIVRPLTAAINEVLGKDKLAQFLDIVSFNRYNGWYANAGRLDMITGHVIEEATSWHQAYKKPIIMTEYGADTLEGYHVLPTYIWSEEFQASLLSQHFRAFDALRKQGWFIGELLWNFADFKTEQSITRVGGNKKGIFTRSRQPKSAAYLLRQRYYALSYELHQCKLPEDLFLYVAPMSTLSVALKAGKTEL